MNDVVLNNEDKINSKKITGLVLARAGDIIPMKNIKLLAGKPLLRWALSAMVDSKSLDSIYVSTDNPDIANEAKTCGAKIHERDSAFAEETTSSVEAVKEFLQKHTDVELICLVQATSPCLHPFHLDEAISMFRHHNCDSVFSVLRQKSFRWKSQDNAMVAENFDNGGKPMRKDWEGEMYESGHFYITTRENILKGYLQFGKCMYYEIPREYSIDIKTEFDLELAEQIIPK